MPFDVTGDFSHYPKIHAMLTEVYGDTIYLKSAMPERLPSRFEAPGSDPRQEWYFVDTDCYTDEQNEKMIQSLMGKDGRGRTRKQAETIFKAGLPMPTLMVLVRGRAEFEVDIPPEHLDAVREMINGNRAFLGLPPQTWNDEPKAGQEAHGTE